MINKEQIFMESNDDGINIKEILNTISRYKKSILFIVSILTMYAFVHAYFTPNIYQAHSMVKIIPNDPYGTINDFMNSAMGRETSEVQDELVIFKTRHIAQEVLKKLEIGTRYFVSKNLKTHELYKASPFNVKSEAIHDEIQGKLFQLTPIDDKIFRLTMQSSFISRIISTVNPFKSENTEPVSYDKIHSYGKKIIEPWFTLTVEKKRALKNLTYSFSVTENNYMAGLVQGGISTSFINKGTGNIIRLTFADTVGLRAKEILDAISQTYIEENLKYRDKGASKRLEFIDTQITATKKVLTSSSEEIQRYKSSNTFLDLNNKAASATSEINKRKSKLYDINIEIDIMENIIQNINKNKNLQMVNVDSIHHGYNSSIYSIIHNIQQVLLKRAELSVSLSKTHPRFVVTDKQLIFLKASLKKSILGNLRTLKKQKKYLESFIKKQILTLKDIPGQEQKLEQLQRDFKFNEKIYSFLLNKRAETSIIEASTVANIRIIEKAIVPSSSKKHKHFIIILIGFLIGLIIGIGQALLREFLDNTIKSIEDIEKLTEIPIYGVIPHLDSKQNKHNYTEAMNTLWSNLEFSSISTKSKLVTITSTVAEEGKTSTVTALGSTIAKNNQSVIILDLDMRKPSLHEHYNLFNLNGVSSILTHKATLKEIIQKTDIANLHIITSGPTPPNPTALIMSDLFEKLIEKLKEHYDYILIDSPPIGLVSDVMKTMYLSDITLLIIRARYSKKTFIKNIHRITDDKSINAGIVLNDTKEDCSYGYGYGYGYKEN